MTRTIHETDVLKPRDPSLDENTDEWPEFVLSKAHVHLPDDPEATEDLLQAAAGFPLTVVGQLEPLDEEDAHLYQRAPTTKRVNIALHNVSTFSYGQYGDGSTAIWAAGKAGWYVVKPGRGYKATYDKMVEAVNLLYFVADLYRAPRKEGKGKNATTLPDYTAQEVFDKYAAEELGSSDAEDGRERVYEHKDFLISSMLAGKEGLLWSKFPLYTHLYSRFRNVFVQEKARMTRAQSGSTGMSKPSKSREARQMSVDSASTSSTLKRKRGRTASSQVEVISLDGTSDASSTAGNGGDNAAKEQSLRQSRVVAKEKANLRRTRQNSVAESAVDEAAEGQAMTPTAEDDTDEETKLRARKNKSSLRPRASKASKSAARKGSKGPTANDRDEDEPDPPSSPTGAVQRKQIDGSDPHHLPKRRNSRHHDDEGIDIPTSPSTDTASPDSRNTPLAQTTDLALRGMAHVPDPLQEDTWICALDGCTHKVYAASHPDSQRLIREHYALHAYDDDERVRMVKKLQAPSLPAQHLMDKVRQQAKMEGFPGSFDGQRQMGSRYPNLIVQRY